VASGLNVLGLISDQPTAGDNPVNYRNDLLCDWLVTRPADSGWLLVCVLCVRAVYTPVFHCWCAGSGPVNVNIYFVRLDTEPNLDTVRQAHGFMAYDSLLSSVCAQYLVWGQRIVSIIDV